MKQSLKTVFNSELTWMLLDGNINKSTRVETRQEIKIFSGNLSKQGYFYL